MLEISKIIGNLKKSILPSYEEAIEIVKEVKDVLERENTILEIESPIYVIGDLHGQFYDFLNIFDSLDHNNSILFLGDIVDRGYNGVEMILFCFCLKILSQNKYFMIRGNHENTAQTSFYGLKVECEVKYDLYFIGKFVKYFKFFPLPQKLIKFIFVFMQE